MNGNILIEVFLAIAIIFGAYFFFNRNRFSLIWANFYKKYYNLEYDDITIKRMNFIIIIFSSIYLLATFYSFIVITIRTHQLEDLPILLGVLNFIFRKEFHKIFIKQICLFFHLKSNDPEKLTTYAKIESILGAISLIMFGLLFKFGILK